MDKQQVLQRIREIEATMEGITPGNWRDSIITSHVATEEPIWENLVCGPASNHESRYWPANKRFIIGAPQNMRFLLETLREIVDPKPRDPLVDPQVGDLIAFQADRVLRAECVRITGRAPGRVEYQVIGDPCTNSRDMGGAFAWKELCKRRKAFVVHKEGK